MEFTEKTLRKFFLEAFEQTVVPRLDSIDEEMGSLQGEMSSLQEEVNSIKKIMRNIDLRLLNLEEKIIPKFAEIQEQFEIVVKELDEIQKGNGDKRITRDIKGLDQLIGRLKGELNKVVARVAKFEDELKKLRQSQKRKAAK